MSCEDSLSRENYVHCHPWLKPEVKSFSDYFSRSTSPVLLRNKTAVLLLVLLLLFLYGKCMCCPDVKGLVKRGYICINLVRNYILKEKCFVGEGLDT